MPPDLVDDRASERVVIGAVARRDLSVTVHSFLAYCLLPNHVHPIPVPAAPDGLRRSLSVVHRAYAGALNARQGRSGHS